MPINGREELPSHFRPTNPIDEYAADRVPVFFDRSDLAYLAQHCCCSDDADDATRERCGRIRFRCKTAAHKLDALANEVWPNPSCDFVAFISVIPTESGGRNSGFKSGYRPQLFVDGDDCDVEIMLADDHLDPGDSGFVYGRFFRPTANLPKLIVSKAVLLREGMRTIGYGTILWRRAIDQSNTIGSQNGLDLNEG